MKRSFVFILICIVILFGFASTKNDSYSDTYLARYGESFSAFKSSQSVLLSLIEKNSLSSPQDIEGIKEQINKTRTHLKEVDFWCRYLEPISYKKINGPLPVEWETEVFEKYEKPYKREGAGLTLAALYLDKPAIKKDSLLRLISSSIHSTDVYTADSITTNLKTFDHFFLCNRLYLLNLASIYTTGFECPDTARIIPELRTMLTSVGYIYQSFNESFPNTPLTDTYFSLYHSAIAYVNAQPDNYTAFDNFTFIKDYVNPLFSLNQKLMSQYHVVSKSFVDYSLNENCSSLFNKSLYYGQGPKGIFVRVTDEKVLAEIDRIGKLLFYDPILSENNLRSCVSCHKSKEYFTDTARATSMQYDHIDFLPRNSPSLLNAGFNHLLMLDGKHTSLQNQAKAVICNPIELGSNEKEVLQKILSCKEYKDAFKKLLQYTPQENEITFDHIVSAITFYYTKFSNYYSPFDDAMNDGAVVEASAREGFNLFMSKAQCATCHFVPQFNGVKPPFVSSEFEVLGVPNDTAFRKLDADSGRFNINPSGETLFAFRTGSIRNSEHTKPYMHNGVFNTLNQVIDFYNAGGGKGKGLDIHNQTLSSDSLHLTATEKNNLVAFIKSLNENITFENPPGKLPSSTNKMLNKRKVGGEY